MEAFYKDLYPQMQAVCACMHAIRQEEEQHA